MNHIHSFQGGMSQGFIVTDGGSHILVDTGCQDSGEAFADACRQIGILPKDIGLIIISHEHADHFVGLDTIAEMTGAPVLCHERAVYSLENGLEPSVKSRDPEMLPPGEDGRPKPPLGRLPHITPDIIITEDLSLLPYGIHGRVVPTPGHSCGSVSVIFDWGDAIVGDIIMTDMFTQEYRQAIFVDRDKDSAESELELKNSVQYLLDCGASTFYSGHSAPCSRDVFKSVYEGEWDEH